MGGEVRVIYAQTSEIDDPLYTRLCSCHCERSGCRSVSLDKVLASQGVHQVIGRVDVRECRAETVRLLDVAEDRLTYTWVGVRMAGHRDDGVTVGFQCFG